MVRMLASNAVDHRVLEPRSGQTKDYKIGICCFSAKHAAKRLVGSECVRVERHVYPRFDMSVS
jgi:hypothetical protein